MGHAAGRCLQYMARQYGRLRQRVADTTACVNMFALRESIAGKRRGCCGMMSWRPASMLGNACAPALTRRGRFVFGDRALRVRRNIKIETAVVRC